MISTVISWSGNAPDVDKVTLIASDSHDDIGRAVLPELLHPVLQC